MLYYGYVMSGDHFIAGMFIRGLSHVIALKATSCGPVIISNTNEIVTCDPIRTHARAHTHKHTHTHIRIL